MANQYVISRLGAIQRVLKQAHGGGEGMPTACIGSERESFINLVLSNVIAPPFRVGTGAITDIQGNLTGQLDVVIEYQVSMSLPLLLGDSPRLYLAEPVCAVLEIKSDICRQWDQVGATAEKVRQLKRSSCLISGMGEGLPERIPFFAIGYEGWKTTETVAQHLRQVNNTHACVDGILVIDPGIYVGRDPIGLVEQGYSAHNFEGERALFGLLLSLAQIMSNMILMKPPYRAYVAD